MTQLIKATGWLVLAVTGVAAVFFALVLVIGLFDGSHGSHGYEYALPVIGLVIFVVPGALIGWALVSYSKRKRTDISRAT